MKRHGGGERELAACSLSLVGCGLVSRTMRLAPKNVAGTGVRDD